VHIHAPVVGTVDACVGPVLEPVTQAEALVGAEVHADIEDELERPTEVFHVPVLPFREQRQSDAGFKRELVAGVADGEGRNEGAHASGLTLAANRAHARIHSCTDIPSRLELPGIGRAPAPEHVHAIHGAGLVGGLIGAVACADGDQLHGHLRRVLVHGHLRRALGMGGTERDRGQSRHQQAQCHRACTGGLHGQRTADSHGSNSGPLVTICKCSASTDASG